MEPVVTTVRPQPNAERLEYYQQLALEHTSPLWENTGRLVPHEPRRTCVPALWKYDTWHPLLMKSARLISAREAERRVIILENPGLPGSVQVTQNLFAGLQLILPGEIAPSHRHAASALRFMIEGTGAYTAVDGERSTMQPGDFVVTPSWTFHDHGNLGSGPAIWMDGLDCPIVNMFETSFFERHPDEAQPVSRKDGDAMARYGAGLLPIEHTSRGHASPLLVYPYTRSRDALDQLYRNGPLHQCHGIKLQYVNPVTGGYPFPTMAAFLQFLPANFQGQPYRSTDSTVYCVTEGSGRTTVGSSSLEWKEHDVFVVPSWYPVTHEAQKDAVLFSFSDRAAQKALGLWREEVLIPA